MTREESYSRRQIFAHTFGVVSFPWRRPIIRVVPSGSIPLPKAPTDYDAVIPAPFGRLGLRLTDGRLSEIDFLDPRARLVRPRTAAARGVARALGNYFKLPTRALRLPLVLDGTAFQRRVWRALTRIPPGEVRQYGELARALRSSPRAVGNACRANPVPIVVPCHRVVARNGLGGFMGREAGKAIRLKQWLLAHERGE